MTVQEPAPAPARRRYVPGPTYLGKSWLALVAIVVGILWFVVLGAGGKITSIEFHRQMCWAAAILFAGAFLIP